MRKGILVALVLLSAWAALALFGQAVPNTTAGNLASTIAFPGSDCLTGKLTFTFSTMTVGCGTDANGFGGSGISEYHPDNYPPAGDVLLADEFTNDTATLTWTARNADGQSITRTMDGAFLDALGTANSQWHGETTPTPGDNGADQFFVAKINIMNDVDAVFASPESCGISLVHEGTAASPTEIDSLAWRVGNLASNVVIEFSDHDDYDFAGETSIGTHSIAVEPADQMTGQQVSYYLMLWWADTAEDIHAFWSSSGFTWKFVQSDTTTGGYPVAFGQFGRDDQGCFVEWVRMLDTDIDSVAGTYRVGS